ETPSSCRRCRKNCAPPCDTGPVQKIARPLLSTFSIAFSLAACAPAPVMPGAPHEPATETPAREAAAGATSAPPTPLRAVAPSGRRVIVRAARVLDVRTGRVMTDQAIAVQDDQIVRVVASSQVAAGAGTDVVDLPNATLLPGFIDMHV